MEWTNAFIALLVAIIGLIGSVIGNLLVNLNGWKQAKKQIGNSESNKTLTAMLGNDSADKISLSGQHDVIISSIKEQGATALLQIKPQTELLREINERNKKEQHMREEREKHLSPEQLEIHNALSGIQAMSDNWVKLNKDLEDIKKQNEFLSQKVFDLSEKVSEQKQIIVNLEHKNDSLINKNLELNNKLKSMKSKRTNTSNKVFSPVNERSDGENNLDDEDELEH